MWKTHGPFGTTRRSHRRHPTRSGSRHAGSTGTSTSALPPSPGRGVTLQKTARRSRSRRSASRAGRSPRCAACPRARGARSGSSRRCTGSGCARSPGRVSCAARVSVNGNGRQYVPLTGAVISPVSGARGRRAVMAASPAVDERGARSTPRGPAARDGLALPDQPDPLGGLELAPARRPASRSSRSASSRRAGASPKRHDAPRAPATTAANTSSARRDGPVRRRSSGGRPRSAHTDSCDSLICPSRGYSLPRAERSAGSSSVCWKRVARARAARSGTARWPSATISAISP